MLKKPVMFVNFKTYEGATSLNGVNLARICEKIKQETGQEIIPVVQAVDIFRIAREFPELSLFSQHVDEQDYGAYTGHVLIEAVKEAGAIGTILNHSENRIEFDKIQHVIEKAKKMDFIVLVCAQNAKEIGIIAKYKPDYIAYEPPELIGGEISVSSAKPEVITESVEKAKGIPLIVGAGIKTEEDVRKSIELGAVGVLVASGIVKAKDQELALRDLIRGF